MKSPLHKEQISPNEDEFTHILSTFPLVAEDTKSATMAAYRKTNKM